MPNVGISSIDIAQTSLWYASLICAHGEVSPEKLARFIADQTANLSRLKANDFTSMARYASGTQTPSRLRGPITNGKWLRLTEMVWPWTRTWFDTPVWYLLRQKTVSHAQLLTCVSLLPEQLREELLTQSGLDTFLTEGEPTTSKVTAIPAMHFSPTTRGSVYGLTESINPWVLGALACAMRESELRGEPGMARWAAVGLTWYSRFLHSWARPRMRPGLLQIGGFVDEYLARLDKPGVFFGHPVSESELVRFGQERQMFLDYFAAGDFDKLTLDNPMPWLSLKSDH